MASIIASLLACSLLVPLLVECSSADRYFTLQKNTRISATVRSFSRQARSPIDCLVSVCSGDDHCTVAFNRQTGQCEGVKKESAEEFAFAAGLGLLFSTTDASNWISLIPKGVAWAVDGPGGLWPLNQDTKGRNLGSKGSALDLSTPGMQWTGAGPRGSKLYAYITAANNRVDILQGGKYLMNFKNKFTMALWLKTAPGNPITPILNGEPSVNAPTFWFKNDQKQIYLQMQAGIHTYNAVPYNEFLNNWRHIAVVFDGFDNVRFYINGSPLAIAGVVKDSSAQFEPSFFCFGCSNPTNFLKDSVMACVSMYERALTEAEVKTLMERCP